MATLLVKCLLHFFAHYLKVISSHNHSSLIVHFSLHSLLLSRLPHCSHALHFLKDEKFLEQDNLVRMLKTQNMNLRGISLFQIVIAFITQEG